MEFFHHWIPNFAIIAKPLYLEARETPMGPLTRSAIVHCHFSLLLDDLLTAPALPLQDPMRPYHLSTDERSRVTTGVLTQQVGWPLHWAVTFLSDQLDLIICEWQPCLRALAAAAEFTQEALKITLSRPITVYSTHHFSDFLSHFPPISLPLPWAFMSPSLSLTAASSPAPNPANFLPVPSLSGPSSHSSPEAVETLCSPQHHLLDQ